MNLMNFGKKKKKEKMDLVKLVTIASTLSEQLEASLKDVMVDEDVKIVSVHLGELLLEKYKEKEKEVKTK